ncbi:hypothetical protein KR009_006038 [Drosophila setifemur]|nr:hypothetical protein KR009_006038 [Drosophila setifemur]
MRSAIAHDLENGDERTSDVAPGQVRDFKELQLRRDVLRGLERHNFVTPTRIQAAAIPLAINGNDLLIQSKSGTGKTLIYVTAAMNSFHPKLTQPHVLIVVPTRELAIQVQDHFIYLGERMHKLQAHAFIGGTDVTKDRKRMNECSVIIGTPGRLWHLYQNRVFDVSKIKLLVLDEADQLFLTQSLQKTVNELIQVLPRRRQIIACSATYENNLDERLAKMMNKPLLISNSERATVLLGIRQFAYEMPEQVNSLHEMRAKLEALLQIFAKLQYEQAVLFSNSQMRADSYRNYLNASGVHCSLISGAMNQTERLNVFEGYRHFTMRTLVATDLMARGVDSPHANLVINLDPPKDHVTYLHRIGRAGRFGSRGIAITFVTPKEREKFKQILGQSSTEMSVLQFPKEIQQGDFNFWDFDSYDFPYFMKTEGSQMAEMPVKPGYPLQKEEDKGQKDLDESENVPKETTENPQEKEKKEDLEQDMAEKETLKDKTDHSDITSNLLHEVIEEILVEAIKENYSSTKDGDPPTEIVEGDEIEVLTVKVLDNAVKFFNGSKLLDEVNDEISIEEKTESDLNIKDVKSGESSEVYNETLEPITKLDSSKPAEKLSKSALQKQDKVDNSDKSDPTASEKLQDLPIETSTSIKRPKLLITNENNVENNLIIGNTETSKKIQVQAKRSDEITSPELTPSLTPLELSQEPSPSTLTPPVPPANSINTKTYCLVAPMENSSSTLLPMVVSNTVDDASSISSDSLGFGIYQTVDRSKSFESVYTISDEQEIFERYMVKKRKLGRRIRSRRQLLYKWPRHPKPKRKYKTKAKKLDINTNCALVPTAKYYHVLKKFENRKEILKRLQKYKMRKHMNNVELLAFLNNLYAAHRDLFYWNNTKLNQHNLLADYVESLLEQQTENSELESVYILNKLSVDLTRHFDIPPAEDGEVEAVAIAAYDETSQDDSASDSSLPRGGSEDEDEYDLDEESDEPNSSSGFVESNESASSGIDTSEYDSDSESIDESYYDETDEGHDFHDTDEEEQEQESEEEQNDTDEEEDYKDEDGEEEEEDVDALTNISLAGTSSQGSVDESSGEENENENEVEDPDQLQDPNENALDLWQQTFQAQYQFIASHVASQMPGSQLNK